MAQEIPVKVAEAELNDWKRLFNDKENWGIKARFGRFGGEESRKSANTLNSVLNSGRGYPSTIAAIRRFYRKEKKKLDNLKVASNV